MRAVERGVKVGDLVNEVWPYGSSRTYGRLSAGCA
jgi:hypothetical protein